MKEKILFMIHCEQNTGYAIEKLETVFECSALKAGYKKDQIHWSYSKVHSPSEQIHELDFNSKRGNTELSNLLAPGTFGTILAFDLPFPSSVVSTAKSHGVDKIISYWGASMSSINRGLKLSLKKLEHRLNRHKSADLYIFESSAMQLTATHGRGIPVARTCVIPLGVDTEEYYPSEDKSYIHQQLNIPYAQKVIFYSGHMEERKGVRIIIRAALELAEIGKIENLHFVICGNKGDQAATYLRDLGGGKAAKHVTFAGYRNDVPGLMRSSNIGVIASTGWDSFTRSSIEMLASGLPLIVSNLGGLTETTVPGKTGEVINPADYIGLSRAILKIITNQPLYEFYSKNARSLATEKFTELRQTNSISKQLRSLS